MCLTICWFLCAMLILLTLRFQFECCIRYVHVLWMKEGGRDDSSCCECLSYFLTYNMHYEQLFDNRWRTKKDECKPSVSADEWVNADGHTYLGFFVVNTLAPVKNTWPYIIVHVLNISISTFIVRINVFAITWIFSTRSTVGVSVVQLREKEREDRVTPQM